MVDWNFLENTLSYMNFGEKFIKSVFTAYTNIETSINLNGELTPFFKPSNGLRQGDPLSGLLFLVVAEVLSQSIIENQNICGLKKGNFELKIDQFADDTRLFLKDKKSLKEALNSLNLFEKVSGLKINNDKSEAFWLDESKNNEKPFGLKWTTEPIKSFGI